MKLPASLLFFFLLAQAPAQDSLLLSKYKNETIRENKFEREKWSELTKDLYYTKKGPDKKTIKKDNRWNFSGLSQRTIEILEKVLKILFYVMVISLLAFLVYKIVGGGISFRRLKVNQKIPASLEEAEENLHESNLTAFLQQALEKNDYRLAVRIHYLSLIKELSLANIIRWAKEKTNYEYLAEMREHAGFFLFSKLTLSYEYIWYGERNVDKEVYEKLKVKFAEIMPKKSIES